VSIETYHSWKFSSLLATSTTSMKIATKKKLTQNLIAQDVDFFFPLEVRYRKRNNSDEANVNVFICISGDKLWSKTMHCRPWFFQHNIASSCKSSDQILMSYMWKIKLSYIGYCFGNERDKNNEIKKTFLFIFFIYFKNTKKYIQKPFQTHIYFMVLSLFFFFILVHNATIIIFLNSFYMLI